TSASGSAPGSITRLIRSAVMSGTLDHSAGRRVALTRAVRVPPWAHGGGSGYSRRRTGRIAGRDRVPASAPQVAIAWPDHLSEGHGDVRRRFVLVSLAVTAMVILVFAIPLALVIRTVAASRAIG